MGRVKLQIKRLETIDIILDAYAKRKSGMVIQEALLIEEEQKARVKEIEVMLKICEAGWKGEKDLKNRSNGIAIETKNLEGKLSSDDKEVASLHTTSKDPETLHSDHDALRKEQATRLKKFVEEKAKIDRLLKFGDLLRIKRRKKLTFEIDVERAILKQLEQRRKEIGKGTYLRVKEELRKKFASTVNVDHAEVKQREQNSKEIEKGDSLTLKEGLRKKLASDIDVECAKAK